MGKRIAIKTVFICFGIFLILNAVLFSYIFKRYPLDLEQHVDIVVAAVDIPEGTVLERKHLKVREIQQSASNNFYITDMTQAIGKKASESITRNDYIRESILKDKTDWYKNNERIIVLPASMEERLANLIKKGSFIDIRLKKEAGSTVETVLQKVRVEDILDEAGTPFGAATAVNSQKAYIKLILDDNERQKIYTAQNQGKLVYELYCDDMQKAN